MLLIDSRVGSKDLLKPMMKAGVEARLCELEFGDVAFTGKGDKGAALEIAVELKTIGDLVSSLRSGRLAGHQLPGLLKTYDRVWLLIEGNWKHDDAGQIVTYWGPQRGWRPLPGRMTASELEKQVLTLENCGGLHTRYVGSRRDTVRFLTNLYRWWTDRDLDKHTSHLAVHTPPSLLPVSDFRRAVMAWPGVGKKASRAAERAFKTVRKAATVGQERWAALETQDDHGNVRKVGRKVADQIERFLTEEH